MPFISFIVPVYNICKFLPECIDSVVAQSLHDWEIILIDDNSSDGSGLLCDLYSDSDSRITSIHLNKNLGPGKARNEGIKKASGDYILFLDGDDSLASGELENLFSSIKDWNFPDMVRIGYSETFGCASSDKLNKSYEYLNGVVSVDEFLTNILDNHFKVGFRAWEFVIKNSILKNNNLLFSSVRMWEDNDFVVRCLCNSEKIGTYPKIFYHWRIRLSGSLSSNQTSYWSQIIEAAAIKLEFLSEKQPTGACKEWTMRCINSCILDFEAVAAAISEEELMENSNIFFRICHHLEDIKQYVYDRGLIWHLNEYGASDGAISFCRQKRESLRSMLEDFDGKEVFLFPVSLKTSTLAGTLKANGCEIKAFLDNDNWKQGLLWGAPILNPEIIPLCYVDYDKLFVVISTASEKTGNILTKQLQGYGLEKGQHFLVMPAG